MGTTSATAATHAQPVPHTQVVRPQAVRHIKFNSRYEFARAAEMQDLSGHIISVKNRDDYNDTITIRNRNFIATKFHNADLIGFRFENCNFLNTDFSGVKDSTSIFDINYLVDLSASIFVGCNINGAIFNEHSLKTLSGIIRCNPANPHINFYDISDSCYNFRIQNFYQALQANNNARFFSSGKFSEWDNLPNERPEQKFLRVARYALNTPGGKMIEIFRGALRQQNHGRIQFRL